MSDPIAVQLRPVTLRSLIFARGFVSVGEFAKLCGISRSTMAWFLRGAMPGEDQFAEMCNRLGADTRTLANAIVETWRSSIPTQFAAAFEAS